MGNNNIKLKYTILLQKKSNIQAGLAEEKNGQGNIPFFTSGEQIYFVDEAFAKECLVNGKNIFLSTGGIASVKFWNGCTSYSTDTFSLKSNKYFDSSFLYFLILGKIKYINIFLFRGTGLKHLNKSEFLNLSIPFYSLPIQTKIANYLDNKTSKIDRIMELLKKKQELLKEYKQSLINETIEGKNPNCFIENEERELIRKHENYKNVKLKYLIDKSVVGSDAPLLKITTNKTFENIYPILTNQTENFGIAGYVPYYDISKPCISISTRASIGNIFFHNYKFLSSGRIVCLFSSKNDIFYLKWALKNINWIFFSYGVAQLVINENVILNLSIPFYSLPIQTKIANYLDLKSEIIKKELENIKQQIENFKHYKQSLINETIENGGVNI